MILELDSPILPYAWGSHHLIAELLGQTSPSPEPQAELWVGAHPKAPSRAAGQSLAELVRADPEAMLGRASLRRFGPQLPYLLKLLAIRIPLSLQVHPDREQAEEGYAREQAAACPAQKRNYRDPNHKPELVCALEPFHALNGFRPISEALPLLEEADLSDLRPEVRALRARPRRQQLRLLFSKALLLPAPQKARLVRRLVVQAGRYAGTRPEWDWILKGHAEFGDDIGLLSFLLLNYIELRPGQAMFCAAGDLHAYLGGFAVEIMANSDNVVRGGCTPKHVDQHELLRLLNFEPRPLELIQPVPLSAQELRFPCPAREFELHRIQLAEEERWVPAQRGGAEVLLCVAGEAEIRQTSCAPLHLPPGRSAFVPAAQAAGFYVRGPCTLFRATMA